jgi:Ca2+-binding RTX toxin-like protein
MDAQSYDVEGQGWFKGGASNDRLFAVPLPGGPFGGGQPDRNVKFYGMGGDDEIQGGLTDDFLDGGSGNDVIRGGGGKDTIYGGTGFDLIRAGDGNDSVFGGDDADRFGEDLGDGVDTYDGGAGRDEIEFTNLVSVTIDMRNGNYAGNAAWTSIENIRGTIGADFIYLSDTDGLDNMIIGGTGNDSFGGGNGNDSLFGDEGADELRGWFGNDSLTGGTGDDFLAGEQDNDILEGEDGTDWLAGGTGNDSLLGGEGNDSLYGEQDNDTLKGGGGADTLSGGDGNDTLYGGDGNDALDGGTGSDDAFFATDGEYGWIIDVTLGTARRTNGFGVIDTDTFAGIDTFHVDNGANLFIGDGNVNVFYGGINDDTFVGAGGNDVFYGGLGNDSINGGAGTGDYVLLETNGAYGWIVNLTLGTARLTTNGGFTVIETDTIAGVEIFQVDGGRNEFYGNSANNQFYGSGDRDRFQSGLGSDVLNGSGGIDTALFAASSVAYFNGDDVINLATGIAKRSVQYNIGLNFFLGTETTTLTSIEIVYANDGNDWVSGTVDNDYLVGEAGNDTLLGGGGSDSLFGETGSDWLDGGAGADTLSGGEDFDFASYAGAATGIVARLDFASLNSGEAAGDVYFSIEGLIGSAFIDFLVGDEVLGNYITAQGGDDYIAGLGGNDTIRGDDGTDQFWGGEGADSLDGGDGYDIARYDFAATGVVARLDGGANAGEATGDTFANIEALYGSAFGDYLIGDSAGNVLCGLDGGDLLYGLGGDDILLGGAGIDAFAFNTAGFGTDTVLDFNATAAAGAAHDYVDFRGSPVITSFAITQSGADTLVTTNLGVVKLIGISSATLVAGDFLF